MKPIIASFGIFAILLIGIGCGNAPKVMQGTVSSYQAESHTLIVKDERPPYQDYTFNIQDADMGGAPASGDKLRISYRDENGSLRAIRIMNLARTE
jgi:hypothetical protein